VPRKEAGDCRGRQKGVALDLEVVWTCHDLESMHKENGAGISRVKVDLEE